MIWGCGTGRCGTKSLAKMLGGVHEPQDGIQVIPYVMGWCPDSQWSVVRPITQALRARMDMDTPIAVDPRHSYVIPLIQQIDPDAQFLWIYRDPLLCIESWLARGNWLPDDPLEGRYHPRGGYPEGWDRIAKGIWFWRAINSLIRDNLHERFQVLRCPDDLTEHTNSNTQDTWLKGDWMILEEDRERVAEGCGFLMAELDYLREATAGEVL